MEKSAKSIFYHCRTILYLFWQFSWGFLQSAVGFCVFLVHRRDRHYLFHGAIVTEWERGPSVSLGAFIFVSKRIYHITPGLTKEDELLRVVVHEYGHTIQSLVLGPLYLILIGIPSALWANVPYFEDRRCRMCRSYYDFFTERSANRLGTKVTREENPESPVTGKGNC